MYRRINSNALYALVDIYPLSDICFIHRYRIKQSRVHAVIDIANGENEQDHIILSLRGYPQMHWGSANSPEFLKNMQILEKKLDQNQEYQKLETWDFNIIQNTHLYRVKKTKVSRKSESLYVQTLSNTHGLT